MERVAPKTLELIRAHVKVQHNRTLRQWEAVIGAMLPRDEYEALDKVLQRLGGTWHRSSKVHVFDERFDVAAELDLLFATELMPDKNPFAFFETPPQLADTLVSQLREPRMVLEPSAGRGALVRAVLRLWDSPLITAVEIDEYNVTCLRATLAKTPGIHILPGDFLHTALGVCFFDTVVMNPPFALTGEPHAYVKHVWKAMEHLDYSGTLAFVAPSSFVDSKDKGVTLLRKHLQSQWREFDLQKLPHGAFAPSGTNVSTVIVRVRRPSKYNLTVSPALAQPTSKEEPTHAKPNAKRKRKNRSSDDAGGGEPAAAPVR
jgi:tRNA1(Val) A37 N6-methylase TrmN6